MVFIELRSIFSTGKKYYHFGSVSAELHGPLAACVLILHEALVLAVAALGDEHLARRATYESIDE